jgi:hypothetical protein
VRNTTTGVLIALGFAALAIAFLRPTSEMSVQQTGPLDVESATAESPLVSSKLEEGGFRAFGITFSDPTYRVAVSFTAPAACAEALVRSTTWPVADGDCGPAGTISGELSGTGRTALGGAFVAVTFEVTGECFDAVAPGDVWGSVGHCQS